MKKYIGYLILTLIGFGVYMIAAVQVGYLMAIVCIAISVIVALLICLALELINP